ncbi:GTF2IRD2 [Cordylochernes scorpioides]|uniref:GTF2IRD2 n=1 Tax=Cordylochernes scorpioides TaxID=51811 RepID=A0ABY6JVM2_9ARAC|nr:GTF2IRD2 [Cordylochernes scorpioides]
MEVIDIQCDSDLKTKFIEVGVSEFYKYLPARFENTRKLAYEIMSIFGSTYRCEQLFSHMKGNKSPIRSRITDVHLGSVLKLITANKISPGVGKMSSLKGKELITATFHLIAEEKLPPNCSHIDRDLGEKDKNASREGKPIHYWRLYLDKSLEHHSSTGHFDCSSLFYMSRIFLHP